MTLSLQEQQDWARSYLVLHPEMGWEGCIDAIVARVRTETLDAVEAGMPPEQLPSYEHNGRANNLNLGFNTARGAMLAHLRALREGDK